MNKLMTTVISASLLAIPFSIHATELHFDDAYRFEDTSAHEIALQSRNTDVTLGDMYRYENFDAYNSVLTNSPARNINVAIHDMYLCEDFGAVDHES